MKTLIAFAVAALLVGRAQGAGFDGMQPNTGADQMAHVFGKNAAFTATAHTSITGGQMPVEMETQHALLDGNVRVEMDMAKMKGAGMSAGTVAQMKQMGMDRTVTISRSAEKMTYLVYPGLKAYCIVAMPDKTATTEAKPPKIERVELGKETVEGGHPCVKSKLTITDENGRKTEMFTWQATDLKQFNIQIEMKTEQGVVTTIFRDIKLKAPDAALFRPPADYKQYGSVQELMMSSMSGLGAMGEMEESKPAPAPRKRSLLPMIPRNLIPGIE